MKFPSTGTLESLTAIWDKLPDLSWQTAMLGPTIAPFSKGQLLLVWVPDDPRSGYVARYRCTQGGTKSTSEWEKVTA